MKYDKSSHICQNCKMHKNNPSRCVQPVQNTGYYGLFPFVRFVNRKEEACVNFTNKHGVEPKAGA